MVLFSKAQLILFSVCNPLALMMTSSFINLSFCGFEKGAYPENSHFVLSCEISVPSNSVCV